MQIKLLSEIIGNIVGKQGAEIVGILEGKKNLNEFLIAKKLKLTINQTRNILYKLSDAGLVSFTRKKDKRRGWYTYFWTLNSEKSLELLEANVKNEVESLKNQLKNREIKRYYVCNTCKTEVNEETALVHNFICSECGEVFALQEDKKILADLTSKINRLTNGLIGIQHELSLIREKQTKKKARDESKIKKKPKGKKAKKKARKKSKRKKIRKKKARKKNSKKKKAKKKI